MLSRKRGVSINTRSRRTYNETRIETFDRIGRNFISTWQQRYAPAVTTTRRVRIANNAFTHRNGNINIDCIASRVHVVMLKNSIGALE
jgi:hypothetical protein